MFHAAATENKKGSSIQKLICANFSFAVDRVKEFCNINIHRVIINHNLLLIINENTQRNKNLDIDFKIGAIAKKY